MRTLVRYGYVPFMLLAVNGTGIAIAASGGSKLWLLALLVLAIACSFGAERVLPYHDEWNTPHDDDWRDTVHAAVNELLTLGSVAALPVLTAVASIEGVWPHEWPFVLQVLGAVLVADLGITLVHLASHKIPALWRLHAVHHSVKRAYGFNGLMKHPLHQTLETAAGVAPLVLLGLPTTVAYALALCVAVQLLLQHSNVDYRVGRLRAVLALNQAHRFHHLKWAGIGDVNFGLFTLLWDHVLRTYSYDPERRFTSDDLGMAAKPDYPNAYLAQLAEPFRRSGACAADDADAVAPPRTK
ncbi:sterol desaturase family protein [Amycolatopsis roodepoortensis]|uniref:sterol desaturase family protein n=1 Tax=Amycolatopsis roodepoortensis TaxID=700274 RepID=UPI00214B3E3A|nr:sterol desaturase family protein [Amycolatopsis roodepoortensis]UUV35884.1 sterol desaturase family protein [Amycolatopsis roodepoortensis]